MWIATSVSAKKSPAVGKKTLGRALGETHPKSAEYLEISKVCSTV